MDEASITAIKLLILILCAFLTANSQNNQYGLCSDPQCLEPIATGITIFKYHSNEAGKLSCIDNQEVTIYVADYGEKKHLIGVELNGKKGYLPKNFVKETRTFKRDLVPAQVEFTLSHLEGVSYHVTSHTHTPGHLHPTDMHYSVQPSVPNNVNSQPSIQYNNVPLESSREEQSHFHSSVSNDVYSNSYHHQGENTVHQAPHMHSSHIHLGFEATMSSPYAVVQSPQPEHYTQNQFSSYHSQSSFDHGMAGSQNFEYQSTFLVHSSPGSDQLTHDEGHFGNVQSTVLLPSPTHQTASSQIAAQVGGENQNFNTQSDPGFYTQGIQTNTPSQLTTEQGVNFQTTPYQAPQFSSHSQPSPNAENVNLQSTTLFPENPPGVSGENQYYNLQSNVLYQQPHMASAQVTSQTFSGLEGQHFVPTNPNFVSPQVTAQTFNGPEGQHFVPINSPNFHSQVLQSISPQEFSKQPNFQHVNLGVKNHEYDETMAMLVSRGLNTEGELTEQSSFKNPSIEASSSFQSTNVEQHMHSTNEVLPSDSIIQPGKSNSGINNHNLQSQSSVPEENIKSTSTEGFNSYSHSEKHSSFINEISSFDSGSSVIHTSENVEEIDAEEDDYEDDEDDDMHSLSKEEQPSQEINADQQSKVTSEQIVEQITKPFIETTVQLPVESTTKSTLESSTQQIHVDAQSELKPGVKKLQLDESVVIPSNKISPLFQDPHSNTKSSMKENFHSETKKAPEFVVKNVIGTIKGDNLKQFVSDKIEEKQSTPLDVLNDSSSDNSLLQENNSTLVISEGIKEESNDLTFQDNDGNSPDAYSTDKLSDNNNPSKGYVDHSVDSNSISNISDVNETESDTLLLNAYQTRHLKDIENTNDNISPAEEAEQISYTEFNFYTSLENSFEAIRCFIGALLPWIPDPLYTIIIDLEKDGISPKVPVFTVLSAIPCIILIVLLVCIKEKSKEKELIAQLTVLEKNHYNLAAEKNILEEKLEKMEIEIQISRTALEEEKISSFKFKTEIESLKQQLEETTLELEKNVNAVDTLKDREREYVELVRDHEKVHLNLLEQKAEVEDALTKEETTVANLTEELQKKEAEVEKLISENSEYCQANEVYEEKLAQLQKNCNQLLKEAEIWNARVNELNEKLNREVCTRGELESDIAEKDSEIKALSEAIQIFKSFEEVGDGNEEECKTSKEKLQYLINSSSILLKLQNKEEENKFLSERLEEEKNKLLEMEVSILDVKSENDKLKINYNQALQDKAEAQTKLEVLTNYFKDKEIQLQRQLGVQEAVRQKTEEDASSAERRICLIEQENTSYKYQVATMKQEMEETERNLKNQIAVQEKKAHENWLAARTAERKLEDMKQEVMQLRQRLTLLEREQENWTNSTREEIIRPVPKRVNNDNDNTVTSQDINSSMELRPNIYPPPPMMLPHDRPLPPLPPPLPPFPPFEPPPFRTQPWHIPPPPLDSLSNSDYRITPTEFTRGRESTPPRGRSSAINDGDMGPRQSSPLGDMRDSRNSTPPHFLPDFHDIPPHPPRPFFPPMGPHGRFPLHPPPPFRKEMAPGQRRIDNQDESNSSYGSQRPSVPQDNWHNPNSRV